MTQSKDRKKIVSKQKAPRAAKKVPEKFQKQAVKKDPPRAPFEPVVHRRPLINFPKH
jgi:hypothetical protein